MSAIRFKTTLFKIGSYTLLRLPESASEKLPSRGQVMVKATLNRLHFQTALEPDGKWGHWLRVDEKMRKAAGVDVGDNVVLMIEPTKEWPEPEVPEDLKTALAAAPKIQTLWMAVTPMSRWEWIRWIGATKQPETRKRRIETTLSKLKAGERRPCCFNRTMCTDPYVSKNGVLLEPTQTVG